MPARPRKSSRDRVAAAFQGLWKITRHIWHQASPLMPLFQHQRMWLFSVVCWDQVASTVSTKCPSSSGTAFSHVVREPPGPHSGPGDWPFPPEHHQVLGCGVADSALPLFIVLMEFKPSPLSFLPFQFSPCSCLQFSTFSPAVFGEGCFSCILPPPHPLSAHKSTSLPVSSHSPGSLLHVAYLLNSVVQVLQIVVLIQIGRASCRERVSSPV